MEQLLQFPISVSRLLLIAAGLVVALLVLGNLISWMVAVLVVCFAALAVPFMIAVIKAEH
jgi:hypothetical protein